MGGVEVDTLWVVVRGVVRVVVRGVDRVVRPVDRGWRGV